jgi:DNA-binding IclR family transcriptional regulator
MKHKQIKEKILRVIEQSKTLLNLSEISRKTGFHRTTVDRYLTLLEEEKKIKRILKPPMILVSKIESD